MSRVVICTSNKVEHLGKNIITKMPPKTLYCDLRLSLQCNQENNGQDLVPDTGKTLTIFPLRRIINLFFDAGKFDFKSRPFYRTV